MKPLLNRTYKIINNKTKNYLLGFPNLYSYNILNHKKDILITICLFYKKGIVVHLSNYIYGMGSFILINKAIFDDIKENLVLLKEKGLFNQWRGFDKLDLIQKDLEDIEENIRKEDSNIRLAQYDLDRAKDKKEQLINTQLFIN